MLLNFLIIPSRALNDQARVHRFNSPIPNVSYMTNQTIPFHNLLLPNFSAVRQGRHTSLFLYYPPGFPPASSFYHASNLATVEDQVGDTPLPWGPIFRPDLGASRAGIEASELGGSKAATPFLSAAPWEAAQQRAGVGSCDGLFAPHSC